MKKSWLLAAIVIFLLFFSFREGLTTETTTSPTSITTETTTSPTSTQVAPTTAQTITPAPYVSGTTTGGTSTSSLGPNSGGGKYNIWGPEFSGLGALAPGQRAGDSTTTRNYPVLIGPMGRESTRIDGLGIIPPSKNYQLACDGSLPSPESLGSTECSKYLPYSRVPGDQDLIPDPYRVASAFSTSTYSSKTEPVPFLTDFSAFQ